MRGVRSRNNAGIVCLLFSATIAGCGSLPAGESVTPGGSNLNFQAAPILDLNWAINASTRVPDQGQKVSLPGYTASGWYPVVVPSTVLAGLVALGQYKNPYFDANLQGIDPTPFLGSWWYRSEFGLPSEFAQQTVVLHLDGVNYRANVWVNGQRIRSSDQVIGTYRTFAIDISQYVIVGQNNALAVEVFPPNPDQDLAISWIDWGPSVPDSNMGLTGKVYLSHRGAVEIESIDVDSLVDPANLSQAELIFRVKVSNHSAAPLVARLTASWEQVKSWQDVSLAANETANVLFTSDQFPFLVISSPRIWWPAEMGSPELYQLHTEAAVQGSVSSSLDTSFGIRQVTSELTPDGYRRFKVNGRPVLIRGAGWAPDLLLRKSSDRLNSEMAYVQDLGLNALRLEGHLESDEFFDRADQLGLLVLPGWQCCDAWQDWGSWGDKEMAVAKGSMEDQARRLRNHPSVIDFMIGSDEAPPSAVESLFVGALQDNHWPNPITPSASEQTTPLLGASGMSMAGPYQWVPPAYWYLDTPAIGSGGAYGFNTETSAGPSIPKLSSLKAMLGPAEQLALWTQDDVTHFHAAGVADFSTLTVYNTALRARYGSPVNLDAYVSKAQMMDYEGKRAQFEALSRNGLTGVSTGMIHWMLSTPWPSLYWNLYGYDLSPGGAYFGAKKANESLHIQYSYDDGSVYVINRQSRAYPHLTASAAVYNLDGTPLYNNAVQLDVGGSTGNWAMTLPPQTPAASTYFVKLSLTDEGGSRLSDNFYWLSSAAETLGWENTDYSVTPALTYSDFTALGSLPNVPLSVTRIDSHQGDQAVTSVTVTNASPTIVPFVQLQLNRTLDGVEITPVLWTDNDFALIPGETRQVVARYSVADLANKTSELDVRGPNISMAGAP